MDVIRSMEAHDAKAVADAVREEGAVILRNVVSPELAAHMREALTLAIEEDVARFGPRHPFPGIVHALMLRGASFLELLGHDVVRAVGRAILGHGAILHAFNSSSLPARSSNYAGRLHVDSPRQVPGYATNIAIAFPLDPFTIENGAMELWPQSFRFAKAPSTDEFDANRVILAGVQPGDAICFNSRCWHRSGVNSTTEWRHVVSIHVCRAYMRQQFDFPRMIPPEVASRLPEDLLRFLGYHVRMPTSLDEFLEPPDTRPYRPGQE